MGRLGKVQRSNKHKKLKAIDPFYQGERKANLGSKDINQCPKNLEEQEIPKSVQDIMGLQNRTQKRKKKKKDKHNLSSALEYGMTRPLEPVPEFKQRSGETKASFLLRVEDETQGVILRSKIRDQINSKRRKDKYGIEEMNEKTTSRKKERQKEKRAAKITKNREIREEKLKKDFDHLQDRVEFGEVAMEPPSLTAKPRKSQNLQDKPGRKSLLLNEIIRSNLNQHHDRVMKREVGKTEKRKNLSMAKQQIMDAERSRVIDLYRQIKAQKTTNR